MDHPFETPFADCSTACVKISFSTLAELTYFDSFGLGQLIASNVEATSQGGAIKLLNLNKKTQDLMLLTKLYTVFAIYTDESTALMSFNVAPAHS